MRFKQRSKELYPYAVTRIHANEGGLLNAQDIEQLVAARSLPEAMRILGDKGWGSPDLPPGSPDALLAFETGRTWALVAELMGGDGPFDVFRVANDYHNLKAAIKLAWSADENNEQGRCFLPYGTLPQETLVKAAEEHDFKALPEKLGEAGRAAYEVLAHTGSGQMADMTIDRAALIAIHEAGRQSESTLLRRYAVITVDVANIKSAVRCCRMKKGRDFAELAIAPAGSLKAGRLVAAVAVGIDAVYDCLKGTDYQDAIDALRQSMPAFERWCDNQLIALIKPQRKNYFTIEPIAAFILGRENEIKMARLILSAKQNDIGDEVLRERLRDTYV